ncbi:MAG: response regulator [Pirellulales bacterium]
MLVLSRRVNQSIVFPSLGVSVEVLQTKGNTTRLGISAPPQVEVLRDELLISDGTQTHGVIPSSPAKNWSHEVRGRLNTAVMGLYLVEKQLQAGLTEEAQAVLLDSLRILESLEAETSPGSREARATPARKPIQALLVEDDLNEEVLLASYLRMSGFEVRTVHDGYEALAALSGKERPDFVLLDMRLPRLDGPATIAAIRQNPAYDGVRIFAVSGSSREEVGPLPETNRIDGWFQKPLNPAALAQAMSTAVGNN